MSNLSTSEIRKLLAKQISDQLLHDCEKLPGAILLKGEWGTGKTYSWRKQIVPLLGSSRPIYVSLFGLKSIAELKSKMLSSLLLSEDDDQDQKTKLRKYGSAALRRAPTFIRSGVQSLAKKYLGDDFGEIFEVIDFKFDPINLLPAKSIICLDDLERTPVEPDEILGLVDQLIDRGDRILLIANEAKLPERFHKLKEKIVWISFECTATLEEVFDRLVEQLSGELDNERILGHRETVLRVFNRSNHRNLRTLIKVIKSIEMIGDDNELNDEYISFLTSLVVENVECGPLETNPDVYQGYLH